MQSNPKSNNIRLAAPSVPAVKADQVRRMLFANGLQLVLGLLLVALFLMFADRALADTSLQAEPQKTVQLTTACDRASTVIRVRNLQGNWDARGTLRIWRVDTGELVRERTMRMSQGQSASFRLALDEGEAGIYRAEVELPRAAHSYDLDFINACTEVRFARR